MKMSSRILSLILVLVMCLSMLPVFGFGDEEETPEGEFVEEVFEESAEVIDEEPAEELVFEEPTFEETVLEAPDFEEILPELPEELKTGEKQEVIVPETTEDNPEETVSEENQPSETEIPETSVVPGEEIAEDPETLLGNEEPKEEGNVAEQTEETAFAITKQPEDAQIVKGTASFAVEVSAEEDAQVTYQWQNLDLDVEYADDAEREAAWTDLEGETEASFRLEGLDNDEATEAISGFAYRCVILCGEEKLITDEVQILVLSTSDVAELCEHYVAPLAFSVNENTKEITITGCSTDWDGAVNISAVLEDYILDGYEIVKIGNQVFQNCYGIDEVVIPDTVRTIEYNAFFNCSVSSVNIPESLEQLDNAVFYGCTSLYEFTGGNDRFVVEEGGSFLVEWGNHLVGVALASLYDRVVIPEYISYIYPGVFAQFWLSEVVIPSSVKEIAPDAFWNCNNLTKITFLHNVNDYLKLYEYSFGCYNSSKKTVDIYVQDASNINPGIKAYNWASGNLLPSYHGRTVFCLDKEYLALSDEYQTAELAVFGEIDSVDLENTVWEITEGENLISLSDYNGSSVLVEANNPTESGTAYVKASLQMGDTKLSALCRIDVAESVEKEQHGIQRVDLITTSATVEVFKTDYTQVEILPVLEQNLYSGMTNDFSSLSGDLSNSGAAISSARFSDEQTNEFFKLRVVDDRTLEIIPEDEAVNTALSFGKITGIKSSAIMVESAAGEIFETAPLALTLKYTKPAVKVNSVDVFTYFGDSKKIGFTNGEVEWTEYIEEESTAYWMDVSCYGGPDVYLMLDDSSAPYKAVSGKLVFELGIRGFAIPQKVSVPVSYKPANYKPRTFSLKSNGATTSTLNLWFNTYTQFMFVDNTFSQLGFNELFDYYGMPEIVLTKNGKTFEVSDLDVVSLYGWENGFSLNVNFPDDSGYVGTYKFTIKLKDWSKNIGWCSFNDVSATVKAVASNKAKLTALKKGSGGIDLSKYGAAYNTTELALQAVFADYTPTADDGSALRIEKRDAKGLTVLEERASEFVIVGYNFLGNTLEFYIQPDHATLEEIDIKNCSYYAVFERDDGDDWSISYHKELKLPIARVAVNMKLSKTAVTLNSQYRDTVFLTASSSLKNYELKDEYVNIDVGSAPLEVIDKSIYWSANGVSTIEFNLTTKETARAGKYTVYVSAGPNQPKKALTVTVTYAQPTLTVSASGSLDVLRPNNYIKLKTQFKNYIGASSFGEQGSNFQYMPILLVNGVRREIDPDEYFTYSSDYPLNMGWVLDGSETRLYLNETEEFDLNPAAEKYQLVIRAYFCDADGNILRNEFIESTPVSLSIKMGSAKVKASTTALTLKAADKYDLAKFTLTPTDPTLNGIVKVEIAPNQKVTIGTKKGVDLASVLKVEHLADGSDAIGFKEGMNLSKKQTLNVKLNIYFYGNNAFPAKTPDVQTVNTTVTMKTTILPDGGPYVSPYSPYAFQ